MRIIIIALLGIALSGCASDWDIEVSCVRREFVAEKVYSPATGRLMSIKCTRKVLWKEEEMK